MLSFCTSDARFATVRLTSVARIKEFKSKKKKGCKDLEQSRLKLLIIVPNKAKAIYPWRIRTLEF